MQVGPTCLILIRFLSNPSFIKKNTNDGSYVILKKILHIFALKLVTLGLDIYTLTS
jgi:hypothetical protein